MHHVYESSSSFQKLLLSIKFKKQLRDLRRRSYFQHQVFIIQNLALRLFNRLILKKKKILIPGIVVAICGLDGSGKSSLVSTLQMNLSAHFSTKVFHLGSPKSTILTFLFNSLVAIYSFLKRFRATQTQTYSASPSKNISLIYAIRSVLLAYDRKAQSHKAYKHSRNGYIVICDRYPGLEIGKMDSPRIPEMESRGLLYQYCYNLEQKLYSSIKQAKFIFQLSVPLEVAIHRNSLRKKFGKETEDELRERFIINSDAKFLGENYNMIDASVSFDRVLKEVTEQLWYSKNWN
jgi:thymidylate kinase